MQGALIRFEPFRYNFQGVPRAMPRAGDDGSIQGAGAPFAAALNHRRPCQIPAMSCWRGCLTSTAVGRRRRAGAILEVHQAEFRKLAASAVASSAASHSWSKRIGPRSVLTIGIQVVAHSGAEGKHLR